MLPDGITERMPDIPVLRERILSSVAKVPGVPLYLFDAGETRRNLHHFLDAFRAQGLPIRLSVAVKSNDYEGHLRTVVEEGEGLDVSSRRELALARRGGAKRIVYTGPGKTEADFDAILQQPQNIMVILESRRELRTLSAMATARKVTVDCSARIFTSHQKGWTKFGIPLSEFRSFWDEAKQLTGVRFCGLHFHISMQTQPQGSVQTFEEIATVMEQMFSPEERQSITVIDMGGGIQPLPFDGIYPWNPSQDVVFNDSEEHVGKIMQGEYHPRYLPVEVAPVEEFAAAIADVFLRRIKPVLPHVQLLAEPGRFICHSAMHMLLSLVDLKDTQRAILDGGTNMIGWEKYQYCNYAPLFNLTHFSLKREIPFLLYGSLCTPDDVWGYYLHCSDVQEGDTICLPYQGAYTYALAQEFIREIPEVVDL